MEQIDEDQAWVAIETIAALVLAVMLVISWRTGVEDERRWTLVQMSNPSWKGRVVVEEWLTARECLSRVRTMKKADCVEDRLY